MNTPDFEQKIASFGREITLDAVAGTRNLVQPLISPSIMDNVAVRRDVQYGDDPRNRLDVFTAKDNHDAGRPVLMFIHGGGFIGGDKSAPDTPFFENIGAWAVNNGFTGVNMTYRLAPDHQWPSGVEDIRAAIEYLQTHASELGVNPEQLFLIGQSAGGAHVAAYLAHPEVYGHAGHGLKGAILLSAVYDFVTMPSTDKEQAYLGTDESLYAERSSLHGLTKTKLPLLVTMAQYDPPEFQAQTLQFLQAYHNQRRDLPAFIFLLRQNHFTSAMCLGLQGDMLAPELLLFLQEHSGQ